MVEDGGGKQRVEKYLARVLKLPAEDGVRGVSDSASSSSPNGFSRLSYIALNLFEREPRYRGLESHKQPGKRFHTL